MLHFSGILINVNYESTGKSPHWVGVEGMETKDGKDYFIISPTSVNDSKVGTGQLRNSAGWKKNDAGKILVPVEKTKGYVVFSMDNAI